MTSSTLNAPYILVTLILLLLENLVPLCERHCFSEFMFVREIQSCGLILYYNHNTRAEEHNWKRLVILLDWRMGLTQPVGLGEDVGIYHITKTMSVAQQAPGPWT